MGELYGHDHNRQKAAMLNWPINLQDKLDYCNSEAGKEHGGCSMFNLFCENEMWMKRFAEIKMKYINQYAQDNYMESHDYENAVHEMHDVMHRYGHNKCNLLKFDFDSEDNTDICQNTDIN